MASSNSQHTRPPGSCSSTGQSTPPVGNNPPELHPHASNVNRKKRLTHGQLATRLSMPSKRRQTEINTASSPRRKEEVNLLKDILDFYHKTQTYPDADLDNLIKFYLQWIQGRVEAYADEFEVGKKIDELNFRFFKKIGKKLNGEDVEGAMDPIDIEIFQLSNLIWGLEDDHGGMEASSTKANEVGSSALAR
ncbi:unnamed protein product [Lactuca virosa]|uniref:Glabrous enhancer-binding protein-like DBD domain-containing protein n=1 Tax=Lactuca virosa TaxID=75947 RepID=A0AAU9MTI0_9ASTR|nr:unnamed protein product [Lactuca virosa]